MTTDTTVDALARALPGQVVALVGAGCSTESGIPDYRGEGTARRARNPAQHRDFVADPATRQRYWARSYRGWPKMQLARPNEAHRALARLEATGKLRGIITQNVDGLHHAAGNQRIIELHGGLARVGCLSCGSMTSRADLQERFAEANPGLSSTIELLADGDAEAPSPARFRVVDCDHCGGVLMPDVVFFGGTVPAPRVERGYSWVDDADGLLVVGSSLTVFSGYRFVKRAVAAGKPVGIVNLGPTRADGVARAKVEARAGTVLPALVRTWANEQVS
ncbi:MAG: NAD-dependent protein deacetylase [Myxococcota bacterium]